MGATHIGAEVAGALQVTGLIASVATTGVGSMKDKFSNDNYSGYNRIR